MAKIDTFGQYVRIKVQNGSGGVVFETDNLRVDFDIRNIPGFSRAKFDLYNLNPETVRSLTHGENYVTLTVSMHGGPEQVLANHMFVSNALEVPDLPESVTTLFCFPGMRKKFLEKVIDTEVLRPSLRRSVQQMTDEIGFDGEVNYVHFPADTVDHIPPTPQMHYQGTFLDIMESLGTAYGYKIYTKGDDLDLMCIPNAKNVASTNLFSSPGQIQLTTTQMLNNPKIGPATLSIEALLNGDIQPASILDISNILFADTAQGDEILQLSQDFLTSKVAGSAKYQTLGVQHRGSNWTKLWQTKANATSPQPGLSMPTSDSAWFK